MVLRLWRVCSGFAFSTAAGHLGKQERAFKSSEWGRDEKASQTDVYSRNPISLDDADVDRTSLAVFNDEADNSKPTQERPGGNSKCMTFE